MQTSLALDTTGSSTQKDCMRTTCLLLLYEGIKNTTVKVPHCPKPIEQRTLAVGWYLMGSTAITSPWRITITVRKKKKSLAKCRLLTQLPLLRTRKLRYFSCANKECQIWHLIQQSNPAHNTWQMRTDCCTELPSVPLVPWWCRHKAEGSFCSCKSDPCQPVHVYPLQLLVGQNTRKHSELLVAVKRDFGGNFLNNLACKLSIISICVEHQPWGKRKKTKHRKAD